MDNDTQVLAISLCPRLRVSNDVSQIRHEGACGRLRQALERLKNEMVTRGVA
jgi:hypothetical protein